MNTETDQTLAQVRASLEAVEDARDQDGLSPTEEHALEAAAVHLRNLERNVIADMQQEIVATLTTDANALSKLADEISKCSDKIAHIAGTIGKAANAVKTLIGAVTNAAGAGLI